MNIIEATAIAITEDKWIFRESDPHVLFKPTNTNDCFYIKVLAEDTKIGKCWNPKAEDILADDYKI